MTMNPNLQPHDVIVVDGLWYMPHHWLIRWRGLDKGVHCCVALNANGGLLSPEFTGIKQRRLEEYQGRRITVHRYIGHGVPLCDDSRQWLFDWLQLTVKYAKGYDFRQWLMGFCLGFISKKYVDNSEQWTCAELPYWMFSEVMGRLSPLVETLPRPRFFRYSPKFTVVFDGVLGGDDE